MNDLVCTFPKKIGIIPEIMLYLCKESLILLRCEVIWHNIGSKIISSVSKQCENPAWHKANIFSLGNVSSICT